MTKVNELRAEQLAELDKADLIAIILELRQQIQRLQNQLAKNSQNSGKPPSSDGLKKKPRTRSLRKKGERQTGGQPGHKGHTLKQVEDPNYVEEHKVDFCPDCQADLSEVDVIDVEKRQVFDIPPVQLEVTEHRAEIKECLGCGKTVKGRFPEGVTQPVQYGPRMAAQVAYLNNYQMIPLARICELLEDFYGHAPSEAFILETNKTLVEQTEHTREQIKQQLIEADVAHFDESGVRVEGRLHWLHVASTQALTYYAVHRKRGQEGMRDIGILPAFRGRATHDHLASYKQFKNCKHAYCNAHHLRELMFVVERYEQSWAQEMIKLLLDIKAEVEATPPDLNSLPPERLIHYEQLYDDLLLQGFRANPPPDPPPDPPPKAKRGRKKQSPPKNLLDRLQQHKSETLAFMYDFRVPFDNNLAERDVRMIKVKQKISGSFRTTPGADTFCAIRAYISTVRKQGHNVIQAIHDALVGRPFLPSEPA